MKTMSIFKKIMILTIIGTSTVNLIAPPKSHALVGLATGMVPIMVVGGGATVAGLTMFAAISDNIILGFFGIVTGLFGILVLDDHNQVTPHYSALSADSALALNIDPETEMAAFNEELPAINAIAQTIAVETNKHNQTNTPTNELSDFITSEWANYGQMLSPNALAALKKVQVNVSAKVDQAAAQALSANSAQN